MKLILIKILNKILGFINKIYRPKAKYTKQELEEEIKKFKRNNPFYKDRSTNERTK